ncbi:MAG: MlaD family protein [Oligosphaeraceae bacterium]
MKKKKSAAQATFLGAFVLGALALLVFFLMSIGNWNWVKDPLRYRIYFPSNVKGLNVGAPVMFRGISVGEVEKLSLAPSGPGDLPDDVAAPRLHDVLPVEVSVKLFPERLGFPAPSGPLALFQSRHPQNEQAHAFLSDLVLEQHLCAKLEPLSLLTGQIYVALNLASPSSAPSKEMTRNLWEQGILPSRLSTLDNLSHRINEQELGDSLESIQKFLQQVALFVEQGKAQETMENLSATLRTLSQTTLVLQERLPQALENLEKTGEEAKLALRQGRQALESLQEELTLTLRQAHDTLEELEGLLREGRPQALGALAQMEQSLAHASQTLDQVNALLTQLQPAPFPGAPPENLLGDTLQETRMTMIQLRSLLETLNRTPQALLLGSP